MSITSSSTWVGRDPHVLASRPLGGGPTRQAREPLPLNPELALAISNDGARLMAADRRGLVLADLATLDVAGQTAFASGNELTAAALSPDGGLVAVGFQDGSVQIRDARRVNLPVRSRLEGALERVVSLAWSPDGRLLTAGFGAGMVLVWEAATTRVVDTLALSGAPIDHVAFLGHGSWRHRGIKGS